MSAGSQQRMCKIGPKEVTAQVEGTEVNHLSPSGKCPSRVEASSGFLGSTGKTSEPCPRVQELPTAVGDMQSKADTN